MQAGVLCCARREALRGGKYALELVGGNELKLVWPIDAGVLSKDSKVKQNEGYVTE